MLLRHTPKEDFERKALTINPAKTCQPIGAMYASLGIRGCLPHSHGSQGCYAYHRSALTRHYKEPVIAATSAFTEGASVFGGQANLLQALANMFSVYEPEVVAVHTTCLSETIGDDLKQIVNKAKSDGKVPADKEVVYCSTPSYVGSHVTGFSNMVKGMVDLLAEPDTEKSKFLNMIPGYVEPSDMEEIRRITTMMNIETIMFPDTSGVLNGPLTGKYQMYPNGGVSVDELRKTGGAAATLAMGVLASSAAAKSLDTRCKVPCEIIGLPIGLTATDRMVDTLRKMAGVSVPAVLEAERGQVVDVMSDMHQYFHGKRVGLVGDPDQLEALTEFLVSLDMIPAYIITGTPAGKKWVARMEALVKDVPCDVKIRAKDDMFTFHQWIKQEPVDFMMGNTYLKYISRDEDIPLIRHGFPILDRVGHSYFPTVGYKGALRLLEKMLEVILDRKDRDSPEVSFELVL